MQSNPEILRAALKRHFGYDSFRPLQEEIVSDVLAGRDVLALLPTGGGKSLCYQLPAVVGPGLTLVVSPLIALMKDQVDGLTQAGIPAALLNSAQDRSEARECWRGLERGEFKLLYVAPERLLLPGFFDDLERFGLARIAIDEAHCISEWGHDFRPEYRQLSLVRARFPGLPVLGLTATATARVREDIVASLCLREPRTYVASFNRPNLTYRVVPREDAFEQTLEAILAHRDEAAIVYCQSRAATERLAERLVAKKIAAVPYHAGMTPQERARSQERFVRDEVQVVCATIAFGMGIHKPDIRLVVHQDLPKSVAGYYQETGRAGRDGIASECVLLFAAGDVVKHRHFLAEIADATERENATRHLREIVAYAESPECRRKLLLGYFGETTGASGCGACDNCLAPRSTYDGTLPAKKLMSCVYRIREHSGFSVGLSHVVEVLTGAATEKVRRLGHDRLSTYGIGKDTSRAEWRAIGRELVRLGLLTQSEGEFATLLLTQAGMAALTSRQPIELTRSLIPARARLSERRSRDAGKADGPSDQVLLARLKQLRRALARERSVPPYIVFSDVTLNAMAQQCPRTLTDFAEVHGVGQKKLAEFGTTFVNAIRAHFGATHLPPESEPVPEPVPEPGARRPRGESMLVTVELFAVGKSPQEIAAERGLAVTTIYGHLTLAIAQGLEIDVESLVPGELFLRMQDALTRAPTGELSGAMEILGPGHSWDQLRVVQAVLAAAGSAPYGDSPAKSSLDRSESNPETGPS